MPFVMALCTLRPAPWCSPWSISGGIPLWSHGVFHDAPCGNPWCLPRRFTQWTAPLVDPCSLPVGCPMTNHEWVDGMRHGVSSAKRRAAQRDKQQRHNTLKNKTKITTQKAEAADAAASVAVVAAAPPGAAAAVPMLRALLSNARCHIVIRTRYQVTLPYIYLFQARTSTDAYLVS